MKVLALFSLVLLSTILLCSPAACLIAVAFDPVMKSPYGAPFYLAVLLFSLIWSFFLLRFVSFSEWAIKKFDPFDDHMDPLDTKPYRRSIRHYGEYLTERRKLALWILEKQKEALRMFGISLEERHNHKHSRLHQLPTELLLTIAQSLSPEDMTTLRACARRFAELRNLSPFSTMRGDRREIKARYKRDLYTRACQEDKYGHFKSPYLFCSYCKKALHPKHRFTSKQARVPAHIRRCKRKSACKCWA